MSFNTKVLILAADEQEAQLLAQNLQPYLTFLGHDTAKTLQEALEAHISETYEICIVTDRFKNDSLKDFVKDIEKIYTNDRNKMCIFIKAYEKLAPDFDATRDQETGFGIVISKAVTEEDGKSIERGMQALLHFNELNEKIIDLETTTNLIIAELDRVSSGRKRGHPTKFRTLAADCASSLVEFDPQILAKYFDTLTEKTSNLTAPGCNKVKIPAEVLKKNLPKLFKQQYRGVSNRVWHRLLKKYGSKETKEPEAQEVSEE